MRAGLGTGVLHLSDTSGEANATLKWIPDGLWSHYDAAAVSPAAINNAGVSISLAPTPLTPPAVFW